MKIWDIGGQSNGVGQGTYPGQWTGNPLVTYFVNGAPTSFSPVGVLHGLELGLAASLTTAQGSIAINKSASNGASCQALATTWWSAHQAGINAIKGLGTEYHFVFFQGENEAQNAASPSLVASYTADLQNMLSLVRGQFGAAVRAHIIQLNVNDYPSAGYPGLASIRSAQANVVGADGNAMLLNIDDLGAPALDGTHYDSLQYREIGRRLAIQAGATIPVWEKRLLASNSPSANDVAICNALLAPKAGPSAGPGSHIAVPGNWFSLIAGGTDVPGCTYARIAQDGSLTVDVHTQNQLNTPAIIAALSPTLQGYAAALSAKLASI